ncbi:MAG TPA: hypothetical protein VGK82_08970 [Pyrinomonadaceae bacterium]
MDVVRVKLWIPDQKTLKDVLSLGHFSLECGTPKRDESGNFIITLYGPKAETDKLASLKLRKEVDENFGAVLEARQKEVSKTDRFQGGKIKPEGLGIKR